MIKRLALAMTAALLALTLLPSTANAYTTAQKKSRADALMKMSLANFTKVAKAKKTGVDTQLNWDHDGCSVPAGLSAVAPFQSTLYDACRRHDFGFANYGSSTLDTDGKVKRKADKSPRKLDPTEPRRLSVNNVFKNDMTTVCAKQSGAKGTSCRKARDVYYNLVNGLKNGATAFYGTTCDNGYFCAYDDNNQKGWHVQFNASATNLKSFAGGDLDNNIKSVWNRTSGSYRVYKDANHRGATECVTKGTKRTLPAFKTRDEVSSIKKGC
ncbi:phospholipase A2 [Nocardioides yefusunii]|uniref:Phospholipase A2 n=1 Tax=Nocardioides yefusunii TaxID=2500546 RepID=A0ABW1QXA7_9ACTN|nr:phospholipase A2 [Nocardioides yefusunii]